ncbi:lipopolysaccharide assembly protein LapA domain-containing protein [Pseudonocardia sp. GCM10023141]|uniref:lipopolysaccharide assembly protein LapA domain-containing protein n=1 Tax=Pseudonocardia sp. GCM10023141 TaxID=3252653 RepID=UPI003613425A
MTDESGRAMRYPVEATGPAGSAPTIDSAIDAAADPATDPGMLPVHVDDVESAPPAAPPTKPIPTTPPARRQDQALAHSRSGGLWTGLILSAVVLLFLLIFILQNLGPVQINFLWMSGSLPVGVAMLLAAIAGLLLIAIPGGIRILQLRRVARRGPKNLR